MDVILDGQRNVDLTAEQGDMFAVMSAVNERLRRIGRGIVTLHLDGRELSPDTFKEAMANRGAEEQAVLEVTSGSLLDMSRAALDEVLPVLHELPNACRALAQVFQSDAPESGFEPFHELANLWGMIKVRQSMVLDLLNLPVEDARLGDCAFTALHTELNRFLEEAAQAIEKRDCVLLGDLLEYELAPRAEQEQEIVALLLRRLSEQAEP